jgi:hypothetical protein
MHEYMDISMQDESNLSFPAKVSQEWKKMHWVPYQVGGITFLCGSACYLPSISAYTTGGWLFTIGSAAFTFTDTFEWLKNNHVGCMFDESYSKSYNEYIVTNRLGPGIENGAEYYTCYWSFKRAEPGLNFFISVIGSTLYLIGSILFIPDLNSLTMGTWVFIYGSAFIAFSQAWKLYRMGCRIDPSEQARTTNAGSGQPQPYNVPSSFRLGAVFSDLPAFGVDFGAGIGGVFYLVGSVYFLPEYDTSDVITKEAAILFILGGISFFISGLCMGIVYFLQDHTEELLQNAK